MRKKLFWVEAELGNLWCCFSIYALYINPTLVNITSAIFIFPTKMMLIWSVRITQSDENKLQTLWNFSTLWISETSFGRSKAPRGSLLHFKDDQLFILGAFYYHEPRPGKSCKRHLRTFCRKSRYLRTFLIRYPVLLREEKEMTKLGFDKRNLR